MKKGFTLSEVLVTLGIVGVISVLTVPAVMKNYRKKVYVSKLKQTYSQITDATRAIMADEQADSFYQTTAGVSSNCTDPANPKGACYFLRNYFKTIKENCNVLTADTDAARAKLCVSVGSNKKPTDRDAYTNLLGGNAGTLYGQYCVQTTSGAAICQGYRLKNGLPNVTFNIDINGPEKPNITGYDVFYLEVKPDGTLVDYDENNADNCGISTSAGCFERIVRDGWKINY